MIKHRAAPVITLFVQLAFFRYQCPIQSERVNPLQKPPDAGRIDLALPPAHEWAGYAELGGEVVLAEAKGFAAGAEDGLQGGAVGCQSGLRGPSRVQCRA